MFNQHYSQQTSGYHQQGYFPAQGNAAAQVQVPQAAVVRDPNAQSGTYPAQYIPANANTTPLPVSSPQSSCLKAIQMGFQTYAALSPDARRDLHARGRKPKSFRKIATDRGIPVSTLWRAIAVYLLYRRYPEIGSYQHLGVAHLSVILGVNPENQLYFLRMAEIERWSRRRLDFEVKRWQAYVQQYHAAVAAQQGAATAQRIQQSLDRTQNN